MLLARWPKAKCENEVVRIEWKRPCGTDSSDSANASASSRAAGHAPQLVGDDGTSSRSTLTTTVHKELTHLDRSRQPEPERVGARRTRSTLAHEGLQRELNAFTEWRLAD